MNAAIRYSVVRFAELLDAETPFALAGCAYCDPPAAVHAFESAARDHLGHPGVRQGTVLAASQLLSDALRQEVNLQRWYPGEVTRLRSFLGQLRRVPAVKTTPAGRVPTSSVERATWVRQHLQSLVDGSLARFKEAIDEPATGYRARLVSNVVQRLACAPDDERGWAELEHDLCYLAALCLGDGRDGAELAVTIARQVAAGADDVDAARRVEAALSGARRQYEVALVLEGARSMSAGSASVFGVAVVDRERPRWSMGSRAAADAALARFVGERAPAEGCTPLLVDVCAWDRGDARRRGRAAVEALRDQLVAEHRASRFSIGSEMLVRDRSTGSVARLGGGPGPVPEARVGGGGAAELLPFLRASALARDQTTPGAGILHTWIALECLTGGGGLRPGDPPALTTRLDAYLPPFLAAVTAMHGLTSQLLVAWTELRELGRRSRRRDHWLEVEAWVGVADGRPRELTRFVELLAASAEPTRTIPMRLEPVTPAPAAAAFLLDLTGALGPFARRRVETLGRQLERGSRLAKAVEAVQVRAMIATARLKLARHLVVHHGLDAADASGPLALSGLHLLDGVFAVLRRWHRPGQASWEALAEARRLHDENLAAWRRTERPTIDCDRLVQPVQE